MSGKCRVLEESGLATALEITFTGEPLTNAPRVEKLTRGPAKISITERDRRLIFVNRHIEQAAAFLECLYNVDLATEEIEVKYEGETPEEEDQIDVKSLKMGTRESALPLTFDMITRALMAAETADGPRFQSTLAKAARTALFSKLYIDSFRYSFLLIEAIYGAGQFKKAGLSKALKEHGDFVAIVRAAIADQPLSASKGSNDTAKLLAGNPTAEDVIDHLVKKRGFYFHGNIKRKDAWQPDQQDNANDLAFLAVSIAQGIAQQSADPIFAAEFGKRHFQDAVNAGASIVFEIKFQFRDPEEEFSRTGAMNIRTPGTKVTGKQANAIAAQFLYQFDHDAPVSALESAICTVQGTGQKVFDITFHVQPRKHEDG